MGGILWVSSLACFAFWLLGLTFKNCWRPIHILLVSR